MRNIRFCTAVVLLMSVMTLLGYSLLRTAQANLHMLHARLYSGTHEEEITDINAETFTHKEVPLPDFQNGIQAEDMKYFTVDGKMLSFPLRLGDLPEDFSYEWIACSQRYEDGNVIPGQYTGEVGLLYQGKFVAAASFSEDQFNVDAETLLTTIRVPACFSAYKPQIIVGGMDVNAINDDTMKEIYVSNGMDWWADAVYALDESGCYSIECSDHDLLNTLVTLQYTDVSENKNYHTVNMDYSYELPEDYDPAKDTVQAAMQFTPLQEKNSQWLEIVEQLAIGGKQENPFPCTLNALMYRLGGCYISERHMGIGSYRQDKKATEIYCDILDEDGYMLCGVTVLVPWGCTLGDAQVVAIDVDMDSDMVVNTTAAKELLEQIRSGENPYGFQVAKRDEVEKTVHYTLTEDPDCTVILVDPEERYKTYKQELEIRYLPDEEEPLVP